MIETINDGENTHIKEYNQQGKLLVERFLINGFLQKEIAYYSTEIISETTYDDNNTIVRKYYDGILIEIDDYEIETNTRIFTRYSSDGKLELIEHYKNEEFHNEEGPAIIEKYSDHTNIKYYINGKNVNELYKKDPNILKDANLRKILS